MAFGAGLNDADTGDHAEINMIPLIDVMWVLLVIFIITAPLMTHAVKVNLPAAASQPTPTQPDAITLSIRADGSVYWDDARVEAREWQARMARAAQQVPQPALHIRADGALAYRDIARIMADAARAGLSKLGFITDPREAS
ncbi:MAG: biopolymer transporter ExbD [Thiobacillus sp.]|nr:biopolymer transporter ExbD [Thiobacillus sp.]